MLADKLSLLLEGARVTAQSMGRDGLGDRLIRMGEAMIAAHDSLAFRFAVVLALAVIILVVMTLAAPPPPANGTAARLPSSDPIYRAQYLNLY